MVTFGINLLETDWYSSGAHFFRDRGRHLQPLDGVSKDTLAPGTHEAYVKVNPPGGTDAWEFAFTGSPGNIGGDDTSPTTLLDDNNTVRFVPVAPTLQSAVSVSITPAGSAVQKFRPEFLEAIVPFKSGLRVMDLCGTGSDHETARDPANAGSWSSLRRACPNTPRATAADENIGDLYQWGPQPVYDAGAIAELAEAHPEIWICMPPFLDAAEQALFLAPFVAETRFRRIWVEWSNEVWNQHVTIGRYAVERGIIEIGGMDQWISNAVWYCRQALAMKVVVDALGDPRFRPVLCWQSSNGWPFWLDQYNNNQPVNAECRAAAQAFGHFAIAPYFGTSENSAVDDALNQITVWRRHLDPLGIKLHAYEAGQHHIGDPALQTGAPMLAAWDRYMRGLVLRFDGDASVFIYGLAGLWASSYGSWGLMQRLGETPNAKWTTVRDLVLELNA